MDAHPYRATLFVLYQLSLLVGIAMLPVALVTRKLGVGLPIHQIVDRLGAAYNRATTNTA
jgi:hypothetical protein